MRNRLRHKSEDLREYYITSLYPCDGQRGSVVMHKSNCGSKAIGFYCRGFCFERKRSWHIPEDKIYMKQPFAGWFRRRWNSKSRNSASSMNRTRMSSCLPICEPGRFGSTIPPGLGRSSEESIFRSVSDPGTERCSWHGSLLPKRQIKANPLPEFGKKQKSKRKFTGREKRRRRCWQTKGGSCRKPKRNTLNELVLHGLCDPPCTDR